MAVAFPDAFLSETVVGTQNFKLSGVDFASTFNSQPAFNPGVEAFNLPDSFSLSQSSSGWKFITAPEEVSWSVNNQAERVNIFGTNSPPVVSGSRGMRDLTLGNSLVEGFVRRVTVESKVAALEDLLNYRLNNSDGFVSVPVYQVLANNKQYGGGGYFVFKDVRVQEKLRDLRGDATRAIVDISMMEVPAYQVNSGRDSASKVAASAKAALPTGANQGVGTTNAKTGANAPAPERRRG